MLVLLRSKKAQNTMEYAILIAVVIGVFSAMQIFMRRGLQDRIKAGVDYASKAACATELSDRSILGENSSAEGKVMQYEPYYLGASDTTTESSQGKEKGAMNETGGERKVTDAWSTRKGSQTINKPQ